MERCHIMDDTRPTCKQVPIVWASCPTNPPYNCPICPPGTNFCAGFDQEAYDKMKEETEEA